MKIIWALSVVFLSMSLPALAQVDLSTQVLLGSGKAEIRSGLESGRYQTVEAEAGVGASIQTESPPPVATPAKAIEIKSENKPDIKAEVKPEKKVDLMVESRPAKKPEVLHEAKTEVKPEPKTESSISIQARPLETVAPPIPVPVETKKPDAPIAVIKVEPVPTPVPVLEPSVAEQVGGLVKGEEIPQVELYREHVHPDDSRLNRIEIEIGTGLAYQEARSNSAYRSFASTSPLFSVAGAFWMTPFIGVAGRFQTALSSDIASATDSSNRVVMKQDWSDLEINFRKFFGLSRKSNSLEYGLIYFSHDLRVPSDEVSRVNLKSSGLGIKAIISLPTAPSYTWRLGGAFYPRTQHSETASAVDVRSGSSPDSSRVDLMVGGDFKLSRAQSLFWDVTTTFEKNQFGGTGSANEPGGTTPAKNVSVQNSNVFLHLGYRWGQ